MLLGTQQINSAGHLEIGGCDTTRLAAKFGTPLYIMDEAAIRSNCRRYKQAFENVYPKNEIYFASKAFLSMAMARIIAQEGYCMDVASLGELHVALQAGFPPEKLALHGNNKSRAELEMAVEYGIRHIIIDNFLEIETLADVTDKMNRKVDVLIRATPGVDPHTHKLIRTGQADTKFGFNIADGSALKAVQQVLAKSNLSFRGIHCHIGSQLLDSETHEEAVEIMVKFAETIFTQTGAEIEELNIGGGLGVRYLSTHEPPDYSAFASSIVEPLKAGLDRAGLKYPILSQEPGRSLVGETGTTLYTIGAIKSVPIKEAPGTRTYASIDGGLSDNPRPQLYEAVYECLLANKADQPADKTITVAGKHCETDILIWNAALAEPHTGDLLAVQTTGAYNFVMASNYNRFLRPAVVLVSDGQADLIVERQTLDDLLRGEIIPDRLKGDLPQAERIHTDSAKLDVQAV